MKGTKMKRMLSVVLAVCAAIDALANASTLSVSDVTFQQRYPWNGLVDITCKVSGIEGTTNGLEFAVAAVMPDSGGIQRISHFKVVRDSELSDGWEVCVSGNYHLVWDARADLGEVFCTNIAVRVALERVALERDKVQLWEGGPYWATTNIGAEMPEEYGYYFWWGDTVGYRRENNAWVATDGSSSNFSFGADNAPTYLNSISTLQSEGWVVSKDGISVLAPKHDAAHVHWGGDWRMPTYQELCDLCYDKCDWTWTTKNGVTGYVVCGRGDYAANSIFLPCSGIGSGTSLDDAGSYGTYWSSVPYSDNYFAWNLDFGNFGSSDHTTGGSGYRPHGLSVRPVQGFTYVGTNVVTLDRQGGSGGTANVTATYGSAMPVITIPTRIGYTFGGYYIGTNGSGTQYYTASGASARTWDLTSVTTLYAKWTANTTDGHGKVQLWEGGPYWATTNIGAERPEEYGYYFWWGDTVGYRCENNAWVATDGSSSNFSFGADNAPTYGKSISILQSEGWVVSKNGTYVLAPEHDAAHVHWGGDWRMPTFQELDDIHSKCDWTWTTKNGVTGYVVCGRGDYAANGIFLPCSGYGYGTSLECAGSYGSYLSSVPNSDYSGAWYLSFFSGDHSTSGSSRLKGQSVRPVQGFTK